MKIDFSQRELIDFGLAPYVLDPINALNNIDNHLIFIYGARAYIL